jgi:hypothetical protein
VPADPVVQARRVDERGGQPRLLGIGVSVDDRRGEQRADPAQGGDLVREALPDQRVPGEVGADHLDRETPPGMRPGEIDLRHAPAAEHAQNLVRRDDRRIGGPARLQCLASRLGSETA